MPTLSRLLRQARAVSDHAFDEVICHHDALFRPLPASPEVMPTDQTRCASPNDQEKHMPPTARACAKDKQRHRQFNRGEQSEKATAQGQRFHCLGFDHSSKQLADSLVTDLLRLESQCTAEEALLENGTRKQGHHTLRPGDKQPERNQAEEQQRPSEQPSPIDAALQRPLANEPPGKNPQSVLQRVRPCENCQPWN